MTTDPDTVEDFDDVTHQPTIPDLELPEYHGRRPVGMRTSLLGAGSRITRPHTIGDRIVLVIEARMKADGHDETDDGLVYSEKHKVLDFFELEGDRGARLLSTLRSLYRTGEDAIKGRRPIPDLAETGYTDASGVVLTPAEVAELRGDPIRAVLAPELTPAVIVYDDGARDLWPDDYPRDTPRPRVGDWLRIESDGLGPVRVERLLHHETGEEFTAPPTADEARADRDAADGRCSCGAESLAAGTGVELAGTLHRTNGPCYHVEPGTAPPSVADLEETLTAGLAEEAHVAGLASVSEIRPGAAAEIPDLPDAFSGDLGDNVAGWEDPDPATAERISAAEAEETARVEALLPTTADFDVVALGLKELRPKLAAVDDLAQARRLESAEKQGRGKGQKPRVAALTMIRARIAELEATP